MKTWSSRDGKYFMAASIHVPVLISVIRSQ